ncbi:MAG: DNA polymerase III subunit delta [Bacteroidia bacterium]|nr:DNA polymerase III subunit delta [Bacteroidia bacterium]
MANAAVIKYEQILSDISKGKFSPVYLLEGEETYFIDALSHEIEEKALKPEEKSFNQIITYGKETKCLDLIMAARRYPMMAERQLIIVREAQNLSDIEQLESYLENPMKSTVLVICYRGKKIDRRKKTGKLFSKYESITCDKLRDYEIGPIVEKYFSSKGYSIDHKARQLIIEYLGNDLAKITNEIDKMVLNLKPDVKSINFTHIEENIGISKEFNIFELQKALGSKQFNKAIQIVNYFATNPKNNPLILIISSLYSYYSKIYSYQSMRTKSKKEIALALGVNEYFLDDYAQASSNYSPASIEKIFGLLKFYDLKSKGFNDTGTDQGQLMIEMVVRIFNS